MEKLKKALKRTKTLNTVCIVLTLLLFVSFWAFEFELLDGNLAIILLYFVSRFVSIGFLICCVINLILIITNGGKDKLVMAGVLLVFSSLILVVFTFIYMMLGLIVFILLGFSNRFITDAEIIME